MSLASGTRSPLLLAELFYAILDSLAEPCRSEPSYYDVGIQIQIPDPGGQRALAALAQTCRGFLEPSLNYLWRKLNSLEPLHRCFTSRAAILGGRRASRPPSPADWVVINRYSHRIQELEVQNDGSCFFLACTIFESNLLPNLRVLKWKTRANLNPTGIIYIQPLLVPGLVVLDIGATEHDMSLASFLKSCPSRCPGLTTVRFHIRARGKVLIDILSWALCSFINLKCLTLEAPVNEGALQHLLMSSGLQELSLQTWLGHLPGISPPSSDIPFPNVKKLELTLDDLRPIAELLRPGDQRFCEITLHLHKLELAIIIGSFFTGLASHPQNSSLRSLHLDNTGLLYHLKDTKLFALSFDTFRPLTFLANLRELTIQLENPIFLNDEELADLAHNWPLLQVIELCCTRRSQASRITFKGLLLLATICPKLRDVSLTLDGRKVPGGVAVGLERKTITALRFPNSPINDPRLVARFLLTYFPSVTSTGVSNPYGWELVAIAVDRQDKEWAEVEKYLADASKLESREPGVDNN